MKRKQIIIMIITCLSFFFQSSVHAGPLTDKLSDCIIDKTTKQDRTQLVRWMFTAAALHPAVKDIASISPEQRDESNKNIATVFMRVLTDNCAEQAKAAIKDEGHIALQTSFQLLGQVAGRELFSNPDVAKGTAALQQHLDNKKLNALFPPKPVASQPAKTDKK